MNFERGDYTIPYSCYNENDDDDLQSYGVINFKVDGKKINIVDRYQSKAFGDTEDCDASLERCVYVGDYIYMLGTATEYKGDEIDEIVAIIDAVQYK